MFVKNVERETEKKERERGVENPVAVYAKSRYRKEGGVENRTRARRERKEERKKEKQKERKKERRERGVYRSDSILGQSFRNW